MFLSSQLSHLAAAQSDGAVAGQNEMLRREHLLTPAQRLALYTVVQLYTSLLQQQGGKERARKKYSMSVGDFDGYERRDEKPKKIMQPLLL